MQGAEDLKSVLKEHMKEWQPIPDEEILFDRLKGLTNVIYRVRHSQGRLAPLIFRKFGNAQGLIDRQKQNAIFQELSDRGVSPKLYFVSPSCRIQQFLQDSFHPSNQQLRSMELKQAIVKKVVAYHQTAIPKLNGEQTMVDYFLSKEFVEVCHRRFAEHQYTGHRLELFQLIKHYFVPETIQDIRQTLATMSKKSIRLCHNDLNNLNIMQLRDSGDIFLIDFEYSRMNYLAYDLANFLNECAFDYTGSSSPGFELKTELIASQEEIRQVSETYLKQAELVAGDSVSEEAVGELARDIYNCLGLCNFYWAAWSIIMDNPSSTFDYLEHGKARIRLFQNVYSSVKQRKAAVK